MRKNRYSINSDDSNYRKGYTDGMRDAFNEAELDAYYMGVGYGKKASGDKHIGFNNDKEREQFEAGIENKSKHFRAYRSEPLSFFERLFGRGRAKTESSTGTYKKQRSYRTQKRLRKKRSHKQRKKSK